MPKKSSGALTGPLNPSVPVKRAPRRLDLPRVPPAVDGIQSNHCRNVACANFGVEPLAKVSLGAVAQNATRVQDGYRIVSEKSVTGWKRLLCTKCGQSSSLKSNQGICEELSRISGYLDSTQEASCPNSACRYHGLSVERYPRFYSAHGKTKSGSQRYRCRGCVRTFALSGSIRRQRKSHENREVFLALVNKAPIKGIARARELSPKAVYDKIAFIHRQCLAFAADRERGMARARLKRLYIATDRQDYLINWSDRKDKRNTQLTAVASADNRTGYVFGMHLNFDQEPDREHIEGLAILAGDFDGRDPCFRRYARYWMEPDFDQAAKLDPGEKFPPAPKTSEILDLVDTSYAETNAIPDPEAKERVSADRQLPASGIQTHFEYTVHAHFRLLRRLLGGAGKVRFFFDLDDTIRAACLSTFKSEILDGKVDAFFVRIDKDMTVDERLKLVRQSKDQFNQLRASLNRPELTDWNIRVRLMIEKLGAMPKTRGARREAWVEFPEHTMGEPRRAVCNLTDRSDYGIARMAIIHSRASLHSIDRYFMQLRRLLSLLERPISTPSNAGRVWRGYSPYRPERIQQLLDIYRVYYNYVAKGKDKKTPAMRIGLAKGRVRIEDILYFGLKAPPAGTSPRPAHAPRAPTLIENSSSLSPA